MTTLNLSSHFEQTDTLAVTLEVIHGLAVLQSSVTVADNIATNQYLCALLELTRAATKRLAATCDITVTRKKPEDIGLL